MSCDHYSDGKEFFRKVLRCDSSMPTVPCGAFVVPLMFILVPNVCVADFSTSNEVEKQATCGWEFFRPSLTLPN